MYSIAATGKWPLPIAGSRQLTESTALILSASLCLPATAAGILLQKRVPGGVEQAAVERRDLERRAADVDDLEQILEPGPQPRGRRQQRRAAGLAPNDLALERVQAVVGAIGRALAQRQ